MGGKTRIPGQNYLDPVGAFVAREFIEKRSPKSKRKKSGPSEDPMMAFMSKMQADQAAQAEAARQAQQQALIEAQKQSALSAARQGEMGAQQMLSQSGSMQQAKDIAALQAQKQAASAAGTAAIGGGYDVGKAQQEQAANLAGTGTIPTGAALPFYGMDEASKPASAIRPANLFNLPKATGLTFGGQ